MNAQIIEDILNQAKVDKNGRIMNKGRLNDMLHSEHMKAVKNCSIPDVGQSLPKQFSGQAYRKAHSVMNYEEFVSWWDSV